MARYARALYAQNKMKRAAANLKRHDNAAAENVATRLGLMIAPDAHTALRACTNVAKAASAAHGNHHPQKRRHDIG